MKLADLYVPHAHKLGNNVLYSYFQEYFLEMFREPDKRDPKKEKVVNGKYLYELSEHEVDFYQTLYVQQGKLLPIESCEILEDIEELSHIGEHVKDLIDFAFNIADQLGLLVAPVGWGKTVLLKYVWFYLINRSQTLARRVRPIYIPIDHWKADIIHRDGRGIIQLLENILQQRITKLIREEGFANLDNEEFWSFLVESSDHFAILGQREEDLRDIYSGGLLEKKIKEVRAEARKSRHYYFTALQYLRVSRKVTPIILIDNVDQLRVEKDIKEILEYVILLTREYGIKILVTLRRSTYHQISQRSTIFLAYPPVRIEMEQPNLGNYLRKRVIYISKKMQNEAKGKFKYIPIAGRSTISFKDASEVYQHLLEVLLNEESKRVLDLIGRSNLRDINSFILEYLASGYMDTDDIIQRVMERKVLNENRRHMVGKTPLWILLSTIITHNYRTRFSRIALGPKMDVVNLYCNGREFPGQFFTRVHVLSYIRNGHSEGTNLQELLEDYTKLFRNQSTDAVERGLRRALYKLALYGLIEIEDCAVPSSPEDTECLRHFRLTRTGEYYLDEFRNYYEYLVYMKDDVELDSTQVSKYKIRDCIKVENLKDRFEEVVKFLTLLFDEEKKFLTELDKKQRKLFKRKFAISGGYKFLVVAPPIEMQIRFGEARRESADINESSIRCLYRLQKEIEEFGKIFIENL